MTDLQGEVLNWLKYVILMFLGGGIWKAGDFLLKWKKQSSDIKNHNTESGLKAFQVADESLAEWIDTAQKATKDLMIVLRLVNQIQDYVDDLIKILEQALEHLEKCDTPDNPNPEIARLKRQIAALIEMRAKYELKDRTE